MACPILEYISNVIIKGIACLVEHCYLLCLGKLEVWLLPPTQAVNSHGKVTSLKPNFFCFSCVPLI